MNKNKIIYWSATGIVTLIMLFSAGIYFFKHATVLKFFETLGYPIYLIYPLAVAKLLGLGAILSRKSSFLKNLAYAGFFYDFILAFCAPHGGRRRIRICAGRFYCTDFFIYL